MFLHAILLHFRQPPEAALYLDKRPIATPKRVSGSAETKTQRTLQLLRQVVLFCTPCDPTN